METFCLCVCTFDILYFLCLSVICLVTHKCIIYTLFFVYCLVLVFPTWVPRPLPLPFVKCFIFCCLLFNFCHHKYESGSNTNFAMWMHHLHKVSIHNKTTCPSKHLAKIPRHLFVPKFYHTGVTAHLVSCLFKTDSPVIGCVQHSVRNSMCLVRFFRRTLSLIPRGWRAVKIAVSSSGFLIHHQPFAISGDGEYCYWRLTFWNKILCMIILV